jgi:hypothetical protein
LVTEKRFQKPANNREKYCIQKAAFEIKSFAGLFLPTPSSNEKKTPSKIDQ